MRTAFVDQQGDEAGGAEESLALLLRHLPPRIEPRVVLFTEGRYAARLRAQGLAVRIFPLSGNIATSTREKPSLSGAFDVPRLALQLAAYYRNDGIRAVHTNTVKAHVIAAPAARLAGVPCVVHLRDILEGRGRTIVRSVAATCSRERIAISSLVAGAYGLRHTTVIENPLELAAYAGLPTRADARRRLGLPPDVPIAAIVGRINRWKGHDRFLRAAAAIAPGVASHFVIAGAARFRDDDFVPELHALVDALGLRDRVTFLDWLDDPRLLYAAIDVHVNCSTREPFGRTTIEAAAAGVPTVCFDDAGVAEFMENGVTGSVVPAGDEAALTRALQRYLADRSVREAAGAAARGWSLRFDAARHAERVAGVLERSVARRRRPA